MLCFYVTKFVNIQFQCVESITTARCGYQIGRLMLLYTYAKVVRPILCSVKPSLLIAASSKPVCRLIIAKCHMTLSETGNKTYLLLKEVNIVKICMTVSELFVQFMKLYEITKNVLGKV